MSSISKGSSNAVLSSSIRELNVLTILRFLVCKNPKVLKFEGHCTISKGRAFKNSHAVFPGISAAVH